MATTVNNLGAHQLHIVDIDNDVSTPLRNLSDGTAELSMCMDSSNTIVVLSLDSNGILVTHERNATTEAWTNVSSQQLGFLNGNTDGYDLTCTSHGHSLVFAVQLAVDALHIRNSTGAWSSFGGQPTSAEGGAWELVERWWRFADDDNAPDRYTSINTMHLDGQMGDASNWSTHEMKNVYTNMNFSTTVDSNGTIVAGYFDTVDMDVEMLRLYTDSDRDHLRSY